MEVKKSALTKFMAVVALLAILPLTLRVLAPVLLGAAEVLVGIAQAVLTWMRSGGL
jgi:hypothetical protein